jgi:hypothetical protein
VLATMVLEVNPIIYDYANTRIAVRHSVKGDRPSYVQGDQCD